MHEISILYRELSQIAPSLGKRDRYGIYRTIEGACLHTLRLSISAALERKGRKSEMVRTLSVEIEVLKHLVRAAHEIGCLSLQLYVQLQKRLQEISRMAGGWLTYVERSEAP